VIAGQQLPAVMEEGALQQDGLLGRRLSLCRGLQIAFELLDVGGDPLRVEPHGLAVDDQEGAGTAPREERLEEPVEERERAAEARSSRFEVHLRPEELDQGVPRVGAMKETGEVAQQTADLAGERARDLLAGKSDAQLPQQLDATDWLRRRGGAAATLEH